MPGLAINGPEKCSVTFHGKCGENLLAYKTRGLSRLLQVFIIMQMDALTLWEGLMHLQGTLHEKASFRAALTV